MTAPADPETQGQPQQMDVPRRADSAPAHDVFVSYSTRDKPVADAIVARLEQAGIRCWVAPRDVMPGVLWGEAIVEAIEAARLMVLVLSGSSNDSRQVIREVERAVASNVVIVPFRIESIEPSGAMAYYLASSHWLDAMTPPLGSHIAQLREVAQALLGSVAGATPERVPEAPRPLPTAAPRVGRRSLIAASVGAGCVVILGLVWALALAPSSPGEAAMASPTAGPSPRILPESALATGDCLLTPDESATSAIAQASFWKRGIYPTMWGVVPCDQPHGGEVFYLGDVWGPEATFPGDAGADERWQSHCAAEFERYVGVSLGRSVLDMSGWTGYGADGWAEGLRDMACIAWHGGGLDLLESIRGTSR